jgi:transposase-like protein
MLDVMTSTNGGSPPDPEVPERPRRRRFSASYKLEILERAARCAPGELGALLRRDGLYSSHLTAWRREQKKGALAAFSRQRGRKAKRTPEQREIERLERENERLRQELEKAQAIIEVQKKVSAMVESLSGKRGLRE